MGYWNEKTEYEDELENKREKIRVRLLRERYCSHCGEDIGRKKSAICTDCDEVVCINCYSHCKYCGRSVCDSCGVEAETDGMNPSYCKECGEDFCYFCDKEAECICSHCGVNLCNKHIETEEERKGFLGKKAYYPYCKDCS